MSGRRDAPVLGAVLAGGLSSRMGREKAFVELDGRPLLAHVVARLAPQVDALILNANGDPARFASFALPVTPDAPGEAAGPLAGVLAVLRRAGELGFESAAIVPCDAPFLPADLVMRLRVALGEGELVAVAESPRGLEPTFALWRVSAAGPVAEALARGERALHRALKMLPHAVCAFPTEAAFANLNTPGELAAAREAGSGEAPA